MSEYYEQGWDNGWDDVNSSIEELENLNQQESGMSIAGSTEVYSQEFLNGHSYADTLDDNGVPWDNIKRDNDGWTIMDYRMGRVVMPEFGSDSPVRSESNRSDYQQPDEVEYYEIDGEYYEVERQPTTEYFSPTDSLLGDTRYWEVETQPTTEYFSPTDSLLGDTRSWDDLLESMNSESGQIPQNSTYNISRDSLLGDTFSWQIEPEVPQAVEPFAINWDNLWAQIDGDKKNPLMATIEDEPRVMYDTGNPYNYRQPSSSTAPSSNDSQWSFSNIFKDLASITSSVATLGGNQRAAAIATGVGNLSSTQTLKTGSPALSDLTKVLMTGLQTTLDVQKIEIAQQDKIRAQTALTINTGTSKAPTTHQQVTTALQRMTPQQLIGYIAQQTGTTSPQVANYLSKTRQNPYDVAYAIATEPKKPAGSVPVKPSSTAPTGGTVPTIKAPLGMGMPIKFPLPTSSIQQTGVMPITRQGQGFTTTSNQLVPYGTGATGERIINFPAEILEANKTPAWLLPVGLAGAALLIFLALRKK